ncbi:hypothetical protein [Lihuaxuella thermophila]|uniref:Uncharacterized protein n=1 Tax=Lihuaxuella thermophila TaxID=1173111 RepID=A0A1H8FT24_9BACL|nr:hypothetical protein [Lihuaxuella thermophila]SEN34248.1 hypothetical protein SAMN05444955_10929 [Lihuaxuella thermophila]
MNGKSPFWYKSGGFLWGVFTGGLVIVIGTGLPFLYHQHVKLEEQKQRLANMKSYIARNQSVIQSTGEQLRIPTQEELNTLRKKIPTETEIPLFLKDLQAQATAAGAKWTGARFAFTVEELDEYLNQDKTIEQKLLDEVIKSGNTKSATVSKPVPKYVRVVWADVYVDATLTQLKTWFGNLATIERTLSIIEWENRVVPEWPGKGNTRVRLAFYVYQDPELKLRSDSQSVQVTTPADSTQPIEILPPSSGGQTNQEKTEQNPQQTDSNSSRPANSPVSGDRSKDTGSVTAPSS